MVFKNIKQSILSCLDLIYPNSCLCCARELLSGDAFLCLHCLSDLSQVPWVQGEAPKVSAQLKGKMLFENTYAMYYYHKFGNSGTLLKELKYRGNKGLGVFLGRQFGKMLKADETLMEVDYILPVPLHPKRLLKRGYNQSKLIAEGIQQVVPIPIADEVVERSKYNISQTTKGRAARSVSSKELFEVKNPSLWEGKHFLVLDDVITTGATMEAMSKALNRISNVKISIAALCCPYD